MRISVTEDINGMKYVRVTPNLEPNLKPDFKPKTLKTTEQIVQELENHKPVHGMCDETWEDYMRGNTKRKGKPMEGNNNSYNCENWIP